MIGLNGFFNINFPEEREMPDFTGQNGTIVIEAENVETRGNWEEISIDGKTAMLWDAERSNYSVVDEDETLRYSFTADESGTYLLAMHSGRVKSTVSDSDRFENGGDERTDTGNDAYVGVIDVETGAYVKVPTKLVTGLGGLGPKLEMGNKV